MLDQRSPGHVSYPSLGDWLLDLDSDQQRGRDGQQYSLWTDYFYELSFLRLDDLTDTLGLNADRLTSLIPEMEYGTASRLLRWAAEDKAWYDEQAHPRKHRRYH